MVGNVLRRFLERKVESDNEQSQKYEKERGTKDFAREENQQFTLQQAIDEGH
jgi:RAB protein geranylgeranyltransferase component A